MTFKTLQPRIEKELQNLADKHAKLLEVRVIELVDYLNKRGYKFDHLNMAMGAFWFTGETFELVDSQNGEISTDTASGFFDYVGGDNQKWKHYKLKIWDNKIAAVAKELKEILEFIDSSPWVNLDIDFKR